MKNYTNLFLNISFLSIFSPIALHAQTVENRLEAENFINKSTAIKVSREKLSKTHGVAQIGNDTEEPHLVFTFDTKQPGVFNMNSFALTDEYGSALMSKAKTKFESMFMDIQINDQPKTKRVVAVPWNIPRQEIGKFNLQAKNTIKIWLPKGVILDYIDLMPYNSPEVPEAVKNYNPTIIPEGRPRLWVNQNSLESVKANLTIGENKERWEKVSQLALETIVKPIYKGEVSFDDNLEKAIEAKAFYYLMTKDEKIGKEAIDLIKNYIDHVSFGNLLDITREIGRTIHITSEVYDWCYDLLSSQDKKEMLANLKRLAIDMEIGWPPFLQTVVNGHGAEAQVHRDLLSMSMAIYDEDPIPYQYCAYRIIEELIPMRKFEYQSPRHNQGINYGAYRMNWDLHAAWLFKRMSGKDVFDNNIKETADFWLYFRLPDGQMLRDGDHALRSLSGKYDYWQINPSFTFMHYSYSQNPYLKHSFERMNSSGVNPILFLLLNDPNFKSKPIPTDYPLSKDFGKILGGMVNRTGWEDGSKSNNVVAEIKGGGYFFSNHQHNDIGALQVYHRGFQVADLGQYKFYGTPYDMNFTKRSISHSVMLAVDPAEKIGNLPTNDGGTRMFRPVPNSPEEILNTPGYRNGEVISSSPHDKYSYFSMDLTSGYSEKLKSYQRNYVFINTGREDVPALIILKDQMEASSPEIKKYWQVNTLNLPSLEENNAIKLNSSRDSIYAYTHINFVYPSASDLDKKILSKEDAHNIFGFQVTPPDATLFESNGHRVMVSPKTAKTEDKFLSVFQMTNSEQPLVNIKHSKVGEFDQLQLLDVLILLNDTKKLQEKSINLNITDSKTKEVYITGISEGKWNLLNSKGKVIGTVEVEKGKNTAIIKVTKGKYQFKKA